MFIWGLRVFVGSVGLLFVSFLTLLAIEKCTKTTDLRKVNNEDPNRKKNT